MSKYPFGRQKHWENPQPNPNKTGYMVIKFPLQDEMRIKKHSRELVYQYFKRYAEAIHESEKRRMQDEITHEFTDSIYQQFSDFLVPFERSYFDLQIRSMFSLGRRS